MTNRAIMLLLALLPLVALISAMTSVILFALLCIAMLFKAGGLKPVRAALAEGSRPAFLVMGWGVLSTLWSITPVVTMVTSLRTMVMIWAGFAVAAIIRKQPNTPEMFGWRFVQSSVLALLILCSQHLPVGGVLDWMTHIPHINFERYLDKNINRGLCAVAVVLWPALLVLERRGMRRYALAFPLLLLFALMSMHSLSAKMGALAGLAIFYACMWLPQVVSRMAIYTLVLTLLAWPALFYTAEPLIREHAYTRLPDSSQHRVEIWHFALQRWQEKPWLGWGVDTSRAMPGGDEEVRPGLTYMPMHPHNATLQVLLEQGALGYALLAGLVLYAAYAALRIAADNRFTLGVVGACIASYLVVGFSAFNLWQAWWITLGLIVMWLCNLWLPAKGLKKP